MVVWQAENKKEKKNWENSDCFLTFLVISRISRIFFVCGCLCLVVCVWGCGGMGILFLRGMDVVWEER